VPRLKAPYAKSYSEDIPELTLSPFAALRHRAEQGKDCSIGVVPWSLCFIPNGNIGDGAFIFGKIKKSFLVTFFQKSNACPARALLFNVA